MAVKRRPIIEINWLSHIINVLAFVDSGGNSSALLIRIAVVHRSFVIFDYMGVRKFI